MTLKLGLYIGVGLAILGLIFLINSWRIDAGKLDNANKELAASDGIIKVMGEDSQKQSDIVKDLTEKNQAKDHIIITQKTEIEESYVKAPANICIAANRLLKLDAARKAANSSTR